ncbi:TonB-dependent receptor plug domain-containing protein [Eilatimonas milleporae]|nr:TonB-dependent receptor [Eilatimonas milleporae]
MSLSKLFLSASIGVMATGFGEAAANAQNADDKTDELTIDEIVITGSFIKRDPASSASPLSIIGRDSLTDQGIANPIDFARFLTANTGSELNADIFTSGGVAGTAQYNLRGLGLGSTLVLLNGRRSVLSGADNSSSLSFVDINTLLPQIMLDRIEILKDGASTLYGSDAVAGVVNHITRDKFVGGEIAIDYRNGLADQRNYQVDAIYGWESGATNIVVGFSFVDQTKLLASEREFATVSSGIGSPGAFFPQTASGANLGGPVTDPLCGVVGGSTPSFPGGPGVCSFDLAPFTDLVPDDQRVLGMLTLRHELASGMELFADFNYSWRESKRTGAPSFPGLRPITVPLDHPRVIAGDAPTFTVPSPPLAQLRFFGRPLGTGFDAVESILEDDYYRFTGGVRGDLSGGWDYEAAVTYGHNRHFSSGRNDVLAAELQEAINTGAFNPFGTALNGVAPNDPAVIDSFRANNEFVVKSNLVTVDGVVSGDIFELPAGSVGLAFGGQYRYSDRNLDANDLSNARAFFFTIGTPDFSGDLTAFSFFAETAIPVAEWMEIQAALRYENYNIDSIGDSIDPKIAVLIRPNDVISLRASFSTAFRAPQVQQLGETNVAVNPVFDPLNPTGPGVVFVPIETVGTRNLRPEEATTYNAGLSLSPFDGLSFDFDYWRFEYDNLITAESAQAIVSANPNDPAVTRTGGVIERINLTLINAPSLETDGFDFAVTYDTTIPDTDFNFGINANATYVLNYDILAGAGQQTLEVAGFRNRTNIGNPTPQWRANFTVVGSIGAHRASFTGRHIGSFINDDGSDPGAEINSWTIFDAQYAVDLSALGIFDADTMTPTLTVGATNLFNKEPPFANTANAFAFEPRVHDPRGRVLYLRLGVGF